MPRIAQSRISQSDQARYRPSSNPLGQTDNPVRTFAPPVGPAMNMFLRCPLPPIVVYPDSLRQYERHGAVPQMRVPAPDIL